MNRYSVVLLVALLAGCTNRTRDARDFELTLRRVHATSSLECMEDEVKRLGGPHVACRKIDAYLHDRPRTTEERYLTLRVVIDLGHYVDQFPRLPEAVPILWQFIGRNEEQEVRQAVLHYLSDEFGPDKRNLPLFRRLLASGRESEFTRTDCLWGLWGIGVWGTGSREAARVLATYVASEAEPFEEAADRLRSTVYHRPDFIPIITPLLKHPHARVREVAQAAIEQCRAKPPASRPAVD